jgi:hypothetical protein
LSIHFNSVIAHQLLILLKQFFTGVLKVTGDYTNGEDASYEDFLNAKAFI